MILRHGRLTVYLKAIVSFKVTRLSGRDEGAGVWGRIRATN
jgi:hypothetical protein